ncbi:hypothetical protein BN871_FM_00150 [Paenibacillus sp. P22]|nr:hypothetical protein BN871_FM_00150 [Paenibacillus sp. P22]
MEDRRFLEDVLVVVEAQVPRQQVDAALDGIVRVVQRHGQRVDERIEREDDEQRQHQDVERIEYAVSRRLEPLMHFLGLLRLGSRFSGRPDRICHDPSLLLEQSLLAEPLGHGVGGEQQDEADDGFEDARSRREREVAHRDAVFEHEDLEIFGIVGIHAVAHQVLGLEACLQDAAEVHDQQDDDDRLQSGKSDMENALEPARSVDLSRLVLRRIDHRHGGEVHDRIPAHVLPYLGCAENAPEIMADAEPHDRLVEDMKPHQHFVDDAAFIDGQRRGDDVGRHDPGNEVGKIADRLHGPLEESDADFVQENGQYDRGDEPQHELDDGLDKRVAEHPDEGIVREKEAELLQPDPFLLEHGQIGAIMLEGDEPAPQRHVFENEDPDDERHRHENERFLLEKRLEPSIQGAGLCGPRRRDGGLIPHRISPLLSNKAPNVQGPDPVD